jgi:hypothetical protein
MEFIKELGDDMDECEDIVQIIVRHVRTHLKEHRLVNKRDIEARMEAAMRDNATMPTGLFPNPAEHCDPMTPSNAISLSEPMRGLLVRLFRRVSVYCHPDKAADANLIRFYVPASTAKTDGDIVSLLIIYTILRRRHGLLFHWCKDDIITLNEILERVMTAENEPSVLDKWHEWDETKRSDYISKTMRFNGFAK